MKRILCLLILALSASAAFGQDARQKVTVTEYRTSATAPPYCQPDRTCVYSDAGTLKQIRNGVVSVVGGGVGSVTSIVASSGLSGGTITSTGTLASIITTNAQTGTTYTVVSGDQAKLVTFSNASAIAVTLPQATGSFGAGWYMRVQNLGAGTVTITPTTSTIDGAATLTFLTGQGATIVSDGTNYSTERGGAGLQALNALTDTWTNSGTTYCSLCLNITNTASAAASKAFDFQVGSTSILKLQKDGKLGINMGSSAPVRPLSVEGIGVIGKGTGTADHSATLILHQNNSNITSYDSGGTYWGLVLNAVNGTTPAVSLGTRANTGVIAYHGSPLSNKLSLGYQVNGPYTELANLGQTIGFNTIPTARTSGIASYVRHQTPADTTLTASTESLGIQFGGDASAVTVSRQWAAGALTTQRENVFIAPTYAFASASTLTTAATVAINAAPIAGTNATITTPLALWVQAGTARFDRDAVIGARSTNPSTTDLSSLAAVSIYTKGSKLVIAYNNGGTITYITIPLDGSTTTFTHSTSAP